MLRLDEQAQLVVDGFQDPAHGRSVARRLLFGLVGFLLAAGCSSESSTDLGTVADRLHELERASVTMHFESAGTGFTIEGRFDVSGERPLPVARLTHRPLGDGDATTVLLTGDDGFVEVDGVAYRLPPAQLDALRIPEGGASSAISRIRLEQWLLDGSTAEDGTWSGEGDPEVVAADVVALASGLGAGDVAVGELEGELLVEIRAGSDDHLRSLTARSEDFRFELRLDDHGEPVEVEPPATARPFDELGR